MSKINTVKVYRNLTTGRLSIKQGGYVVGHCDQILLDAPIFTVNEKGRDYVRANKTKVVHAYIEGTVCGIDNYTPYKGRVLDTSCGECPAYDLTRWFTVTYNPYTHNHFLNKQGGRWIFKAEKVLINKAGGILARA